MLVIYFKLSAVGTTTGAEGKGRELLPTTAWWQFPALAPEELRVISRNTEIIEIPNKTFTGSSFAVQSSISINFLKQI
jgi:hypothetical protein